MDLGGCISVVISFVAVLVSIMTFFKNTKRARKEATLNAYNTLQEQALDELNKYSKKAISKACKYPDSSEYKDITCCLARIEHFSVGVNTKIYDLKTVRRMGGAYIVSLYNKTESMIQEKEKRKPNNKHYDEFSILIKNLKKKQDKM